MEVNVAINFKKIFKKDFQNQMGLKIWGNLNREKSISANKLQTLILILLGYRIIVQWTGIRPTLHAIL